MRYKVTISKDGTKAETEVLDHGEHECKEILNVCSMFGKVINILDKDDENPVHEFTHVNK